MSNIKEFCKILEDHAVKKDSLYDGSSRKFTTDTALRFSMEELGEIASALTRDRPILAKYECIDLAHCMYLLWRSIDDQNSK